MALCAFVFLTNGAYGLSVGQYAKAILEDASGVEEGQGHAQYPLEAVLHASEGGASWVLHLVK